MNKKMSDKSNYSIQTKQQSEIYCSVQNTQLTSMKVSMLSIRACALPMMNWFTQAMAWDLQEPTGTLIKPV